MDNSFGGRPPWNPNLGQNGQVPRYPMGMDPRLAMQNNNRPGNFQMNGFPNAQSFTPNSAGGYPMWDLDIPSQMFMQAVNFDRLMTPNTVSQAGTIPMNDSSAGRSLDDSQHRSEANLDLIEQQQAVEQTRLLQRFKELRHMQQQQQEVLMSQQQQQLTMLRKEQERIHGIITKQRDQQWGGGQANSYNEMSTPPRLRLPPGVDLAQLMASQQMNSQQRAALPKPVMYVQPKEEDDEIKTNPDLFSDTNSNRGSQAGVDEGMFPIPDSASEASVEVTTGRHHKLPNNNNNIHFQQRFNPHEMDAPKKMHRSFAELEADEDFINQSYNSPTLLEMHHGKSTDKNHRDDKTGELEDVAEDEQEDDEESDEDSEEDSDDDDDESSEEDEDVTQENTQIEVVKDLDDIPIKPGVEGGKTFEQLLEEQLRLEEEKLKQASANTDSPAHPKRSFLKKGQGIARFEKPAQKPSKSKRAQKSSTSTSTGSSKSTTTKSAGQQKHGMAKPTGKPPVQSNSKSTSSQPGSKSTQSTHNKGQKLDTKVKRSGSKSPAREPAKLTTAVNAEGNKKISKKAKKPESIPDDASFVASLKEREKESQRDMEDLDEFEILEEFADNMSFCSNSSIVTKGLRGLQSDRILTGVLPKSHDPARPASPRAALIKKLEAEKQSKIKKQETNARRDQNVNSSAKHTDSVKTDSAPAKVSENISIKANTHAENEDEYETVSESSDDSSDDSDEESDTDAKSETQKVNFGNGELKYQTRTGSVDNLRTLMEDRANKSKNDSVLSTDKKLERVLSYTGMTESSISHTSDSDLSSSDSDSDGENEGENISPTKVLTRKVAGRDDKSVTKNPIYGNPEYLTASLNSSTFVPKSKSPLVISREKVSVSKVPFSDGVREDFKFSYHSDTDSVGKQRHNSSSDDTCSEKEELDFSASKSKRSVTEKKTLFFDDDDEWDDGTPDVKKKSRHESRGETDHDKTLVEDSDENRFSDSNKPQAETDSTPPTSKLVSKLFPKLKPQQKKKEEQDLQKIQTVSQADVGDGVQSKVLRDKLLELEREIEKFRNENAHLAKLRSEREEGLSKLKKEITDFEKEKADELRRLEEFKNEEMKKLRHEKKMFEKYQKAARAGPDKKEREEIEMLKSQLSELQEEMKRKESRWTANNTRLRDKIDSVEQENEELKEEIKILERKRLEWMQKDQNKTRGKQGNQIPIRSSTPTEEITQPHLHNGYSEHGTDMLNDLSATSSIRSSVKPSQAHAKANIHSSFSAHSKHGTSHQAAAQNKVNNNSHQSGKSNVSQNSAKLNQSKKGNTHNAKQSQSIQGASQNKPGQKPGTKTQNTGKGTAGFIRNSLAEDLPRRELGTVAELQDVSMYSETDGGDMSMQAIGNMPRKFARPAVDKSIIDKGDNDYDEMQHSDGKVERTYKSGAREILFSNGTRKEISEDGKSIIVSFFNGDYKQIMPDQRVVYFYAEAQTTHTSYPDGLEILQFPNQQTEKLYPDGTKEITFPDQTVKYIFPNGSEESIFADGTVIRLEKNGDKTMEFPNGQREIHTQEYKKREYPDGTVKTVYPDGRQETRYSNGRLRIKDKDGNVIVDRLC